METGASGERRAAECASYVHRGRVTARRLLGSLDHGDRLTDSRSPFRVAQLHLGNRRRKSPALATSGWSAVTGLTAGVPWVGGSSGVNRCGSLERRRRVDAASASGRRP